MVKYDAKVIGKFASQLYRRALWIVIGATVVGLVCGAVLAMLAAVAMTSPYRRMIHFQLNEGMIMGALVVLGGFTGFLIGDSRAFFLRLQAQTALCQAEIEKNTRALLEQRRVADHLPPPSVERLQA
jgi:hypothetical protein